MFRVQLTKYLVAGRHLNLRNITQSLSHICNFALLLSNRTTITLANVNQSINQSEQIFIAPYVASELEAHKWQRLGRVFTFTVSDVK